MAAAGFEPGHKGKHKVPVQRSLSPFTAYLRTDSLDISKQKGDRRSFGLRFTCPLQVDANPRHEALNRASGGDSGLALNALALKEKALKCRNAKPEECDGAGFRSRRRPQAPAGRSRPAAGHSDRAPALSDGSLARQRGVRPRDFQTNQNQSGTSMTVCELGGAVGFACRVNR
jgi:hypothetical protein